MLHFQQPRRPPKWAFLTSLASHHHGTDARGDACILLDYGELVKKYFDGILVRPMIFVVAVFADQHGVIARFREVGVGGGAFVASFVCVHVYIVSDWRGYVKKKPRFL